MINGWTNMPNTTKPSVIVSRNDISADARIARA